MLLHVLQSLLVMGLFTSAALAEDLERMVQQQVQNLNEWADALEAGATAEKLKALEAKVTELDRAVAKLEVPAEQEQRLREKFEGPMQEALFRVGDALTKSLIDELGALADAHQGGADEKEIEALRREASATADKLEKLNLSDSPKKKLREKHDEALRAAIRRALDIEKPLSEP